MKRLVWTAAFLVLHLVSISPAAERQKPSSSPPALQSGFVSARYADAFLKAILPQLSEFSKKAQINVKTPILVSDVDRPTCAFGARNKQPFACIYLKTGDRFWYEHGHVCNYNAPDSAHWPAPDRPLDQKPPRSFFGPVAISSAQALSIARSAVERLGYSARDPRLKKDPEIVPPWKYGTNYFARYFLNWAEGGQGFIPGVVEVDASTGRLKALLFCDYVYSSLWREPPKVGVPLEIVEPAREPPPATPSIPTPPPSVPPEILQKLHQR